MEKRLILMGDMDNSDGTYESANRVYKRSGLMPTIPASGGGTPKTVRSKAVSLAQRGRPADKRFLLPKRTEYGKEIRKKYEAHEIDAKRSNIQRLEPRKDGLSNCITTVQKDYMYMAEVKTKGKIEDYLYKSFGVFKLTPRECGRLMGVHDDEINRMAKINSNTQLYKQFGNSIVVSCLIGIFSQLHIQDHKAWNDMSDDEKYEIIGSDFWKEDNNHEDARS